MTLYVVMAWIGPEEQPLEFVGIFSTVEKAEAACKNGNYFVGPATLDYDCDQSETKEWPGAYYPIKDICKGF